MFEMNGMSRHEMETWWEVYDPKLAQDLDGSLNDVHERNMW